MPIAPDLHQRVVTARSVQEFFSQPEATTSIQEAAPDPIEQAQFLGMLGQALREIDTAQVDADDPEVLASPQDAGGALLQSFLASGEGARVSWAPLVQGLELKFEAVPDWFGWARSLLDHVKRKNAHPIVRPASGAPTEPFPERGRVAVLGDWGTGLYGAPKCAAAITHDPKPFAMLLHLGDVYYSGTADEIRDRFIAFWPKRPEAVINRAINSNHEMYSGGFAYFDDTLARFRQAASSFVHQNDQWTLIGLDTAYVDHAIDATQAQWLRDVVAAVGNRRIILFSHQQLFSHFDSQGEQFITAIGDVLRSGRVFAWYWGHEHRCVLYEKHSAYGLLARCIGHGGMPYNRKDVKNFGVEHQVGDLLWRRVPEKTGANWMDGSTIPSSLVLDGPNRYTPGKEQKLGPHGYAVLEFDKAELVEVICDADGTELLRQRLT